VIGKRGERSTGRVMTAERWQQVFRLMDAAYGDYLTSMATLRERIVTDLKRKLTDSQVLDHPREGSTQRSSPPRRRR
jgi:hypothetical protein